MQVVFLTSHQSWCKMVNPIENRTGEFPRLHDFVFWAPVLSVEGGGFEMYRPVFASAPGKLRIGLPELVRRFWRKMRSPPPIESNWSRLLDSPEQKHRQNLRDFGALAPAKYGAPNLAGGGRGIRTGGTRIRRVLSAAVLNKQEATLEPPCRPNPTDHIVGSRRPQAPKKRPFEKPF
jgi:hypothetical protein